MPTEAEVKLLKYLRALKQALRENKLFSWKPTEKQYEFLNCQKKRKALIASNQCGKTQTLLYELALHLTGLYPDDWKGVKYDRPIDAWLCGETSERVRDTLQVALLGQHGQHGTGLIPKECLNFEGFISEPGVQCGVRIFQVKSAFGGLSTLQFFNYKQQREAFQGSTIDMVCIARGQKVLMADGGYTEIQDISIGDMVMSMDDKGKMVPRRVSNIMCKGVKDVVRLEPRHGAGIICTPDHEVYANLRKKVEASEAKQVIAAECGYEPPDTISLGRAWYAWAGLVCSEGSTSCRKITMSDGEAVKTAIELLGDKGRVRRKDFDPKHNHVPDWFLYWDEFWDTIPAGPAHEKKVPGWVFKSSNKDVKTFLGYLYAGDGWITNKQIGYATTSLELANDVANLLWRVGIKAGVFKRISKIDTWRDQYFVMVTSLKQVKAFMENIYVPGKSSIDHPIYQSIAHRELGYQHRVNILKSALADRWNAAKSHDKSHSKTRSQILQCPVRCCESNGASEVWDLTVEGEHRFFVNSILVSNCFDEEPPSDIHGECVIRIAVKDGYMLYSFTPLKGQTDVWRSIVTDPNAATFQISMDDCPWMTPGKIQRILDAGNYSEMERRARRYGIPAVGSGQIFQFEPDQYLCDSFTIPSHWPRLGGLDIGKNHPTGAVAIAWDRESNSVYCYQEYKRKATDVAEIARNLRHWNVAFATSHDAFNDTLAGNVSKMFKAEGLECFSAGRGDWERIEKAKRMIGDGRLWVFKDRCPFLAEEIRSYRTKGDSDDIIFKFDDDVIDAFMHAVAFYEKATVDIKRKSRGPDIPPYRASSDGYY